MTHAQELQSLVAATLAVSGYGQRWPNAFALADALNLMCKPRERSGAMLYRREIHYDRSASPLQQQLLLGREIARWALLAWDMGELSADLSVVAAGLVDACSRQSLLRLLPPVTTARRRRVHSVVVLRGA